MWGMSRCWGVMTPHFGGALKDWHIRLCRVPQSDALFIRDVLLAKCGLGRESMLDNRMIWVSRWLRGLSSDWGHKAGGQGRRSSREAGSQIYDLRVFRVQSLLQQIRDRHGGTVTRVGHCLVSLSILEENVSTRGKSSG